MKPSRAPTSGVPTSALFWQKQCSSALRVGPLKHLSKEALEAAAEPDDLSEWADMQFLLWDAQHRSGIADEQITQAMIEKLAVNKQRSWPEPKDGKPRLHIKEQPRKKVDRCDVCTEGARGGCGTCIFNGNFE